MYGMLYNNIITRVINTHSIIIMEAVMALCHFCEHHGPSVVFTCEKVAMDKRNGHTKTDRNRDGEAEPGSTDTIHETSTPGRSESQECGGSNQNNQIKSTDLCQACRSLQDSSDGFVSHDKEAGYSYVSTQHPHSPEVFRLVRQACVRSLSCEVCPGREGPIMYGDEQHGYAISYTFYVKDNLARGQRKWYSIVCLMSDRVFLIQSWPFLVGCVGKIVDYLQERSNAVFANESAHSTQLGAGLKARMSDAVTPRNFRQHRGPSSNPRALIELTANPELYSYFHTAFTWIMRSCRKRLKETMVRGAPMDDDVVREEMRCQSRSSDSKEECDAVASELGAGLRISQPAYEFTSLRHMRDILQPPLFKALAWHLLIGNQVIWRGQNQTVVSSALNVLKDILPVGCVRLVTESDVYVNSYEANLLGLTAKARIPAHTLSSEFFILIDVVSKPKSSQLYPLLFDNSSHPATLLNSAEYQMTSGCIVPEKGPEILNKLEVVLANEALSAAVARHCLVCIKDEWMNKVKVLYKFTKIDNRDKEDTTRLLQTVLNCSEEDVRLLKFWMTGLSSRFKQAQRQHVLNP